ncbi:MAG: DNRLRE domain-containing protein, partial [Clostridiales bacterium]|nr:DNRLRE domain-containing protein [Clostridiales bacterium]
MDEIKKMQDEIYLAKTEREFIAEAPVKEVAAEEIEIAENIRIEDVPKKKFQVNEIPELRGENRKVYRMSNGDEQAVFFSEPMHVYDEESETFVEVDNTLTEEADKRHFRNGKNRFVARFSREEENDELFSIEEGMCKITVSAKKNNKERGHGIVPILHKQSAEIQNVADGLVFDDVISGADMEYHVTGSGVKENIIVKEKADVYRYPFALKCENVIATFNEDEQCVVFKSVETEEEVFMIPAPFMSDANGIVSTGVFYEVKDAANGDLQLTVIADSEWMNAEDRAFPVTIDPQIVVKGSSSMTTYSWNDGRLYTGSVHTVGTSGSGDGSCNANRMYLKFNMPTLPRNPRIKKAELKLFQSGGVSQCCEYPKFGLYQVTGDLCTGTCTPVNSANLIDFERMKTGHCEDGEVISYTFDITSMIDTINKGESSAASLVVKMLDEANPCNNYVSLYGSSYSTYAPQIAITYELSYGVNNTYRAHSHEIGRFGQGSIDLACGNLMFESEDFTWAGNRMPVTLRHLYNSALAAYQYTKNSAIKLNAADFSAMKIGNGFKLNVMQSMTAAAFQHEGTAYSGYVYVGEDGSETYFKKSAKTCPCDSNSQCYHLYESVLDGDLLYDPEKRILTSGSDKYAFDVSGRLISVTDEFGNKMVITYTSGRITSVTDGAGREFGFAYSATGNLTSITAPDGTSVCYIYNGSLLSDITYPDGKKVQITYASSKPQAVILLDASGANIYKVAYTFNGNRLASVTEYGVENDKFVEGAKSVYSYSVSSGKTVVTTTEKKDEGETADNVVTTTYTFDDDGNVVSEYVYSVDRGNVGGDGEESGINPYSGDGGAGVVSNINNLLVGHNFETLDHWNGEAGNDENFSISDSLNERYAKFGKMVLRMQSSNADAVDNGVYQTSMTLPTGEYTFSAYLRVLYSNITGGENPGAFLRVTAANGVVLAETERIFRYDSEYTRLIAPFVLDSAQTVKVHILMSGKGTAYADAAQLENNPFANAYNLLENGNFEHGTDRWMKPTPGVGYSAGTCFNMSKALYMSGDINSARYVYQDAPVRTTRSTRETFTLSGWAKGYGIVNREREGCPDAQFRLRAVVKYYDTYYREYGMETYTADFSPCTEEWQFASVQFAKEKYRTIQYVRIYCDYGYNVGTVYFDDVQLVRNSLENYLSASDFAVESTGGADDAEETESDTMPIFKEKTDKFGNALTETTFTDGEFGTIYRSFGFTPDCNCVENAGNDLIRETDARGNNTEYTVDRDTSRNEEVTDRLGNKTAYEYDAAGKTTKVTSKKPDGTEIAHVSYAYDAFDNMTEITRGDGMKYALTYNAYHNLESIGIQGKSEKLVTYGYKNGNGRLKSITYANGSVMKATYNSIGQMIAEKWFENATSINPIAHYKYVYDGQGNIVRSLDILQKKEYTYTYENSKIIRAAENDITLNASEIITGKTLANSIIYSYDSEDKLAQKRIVAADGTEQTIWYENPENGSPVVKFKAGGKTVTSHSKTDSFGRKEFDELQLGTGFISRQFHYHAGTVTQEHVDAAKLKSSATTQLVSQVVLSDGRRISYEYDAEERITKVTDSIDGVTEYTYDVLGQLLTERHDGVVVNTMTYDNYDNYGNYGNIESKNGKAYTYDATWKDLLTSYDGQSITYDAQGNPTSYLGHT